MNLSMRLTKLEESFFALSSHLEGERVLRKVDDDKCKQHCQFLEKQILEIKENQPTESFNEAFLSLKDELLNIIDEKIDSKMIENKKGLELQYINNIEKINKNRSITSFENNKIDKEISQYRYELNNLNKKIEDFDKIYDKKIKEILNKIDDLYIQNNNFKKENDNLTNQINDFNKILNQFKNEEKNNLNKINNDFKQQLNSINSSIEGRINNIHNEKKDNSYLNKLSDKLSLLKNDFDSLSNNYLKEIDELRKNLNKENNIKNKEISNFERHTLEEYENFTKFITNILNQNIDKIKSISQYMSSDIEIIKNKNLYLEGTLLKMREDIYDSLEKNVKYLMDKIHSYMDIQNFNISDNKENNEKNENNVKNENKENVEINSNNEE